MHLVDYYRTGGLIAYRIEADENTMQQLGLHVEEPGPQCGIRHLGRVVHTQQEAQADGWV